MEISTSAALIQYSVSLAPLRAANIQPELALQLPVSELYPAFQMGVIDGFFIVSDGSFSPQEFIRTSRLNELNIHFVPLDF